MSGFIVLLTSPEEGPFLKAKLLQELPELAVETVSDEQALRQARQNNDHRNGDLLRLIAFCTDVIVPADLLGGFTCGAYNFHPGPPAYPGAHAASFAIYEQATTFGVTAHEMLEMVDAGVIVGVEEFAIPMDVRFLDLEVLTYQYLLGLFDRLLPQLCNLQQPLPSLDIRWGENKRTKQDFSKMRRVTHDMSENEIRLRWRAFG